MPRKYPFEKMAIGDSFTLPAGEVRLDNIKSYAYRNGVKLKKRFVTAQLPDGRIRVTREAERPVKTVYEID